MYRPGEWAEPADANIDPVLAEIVQAYRARAARKTIPRADVRETLRALAQAEPEEARKRWRALDAATKAAIGGAHHQQFRRLHGAGVRYHRGLAYHRSGPENLPELAKLAARALRGSEGGRPSAFWEEHLAASLAAYWWKTHGTQPAIQANTDYDPTPFQAWAKKIFERVKRIPDYRTLQAGIRKARREGLIPHK
jgi:hypothetical protein